MMPYELILGGGATAVVGMLGYFLKKTHEKIDATAAAVNSLGRDVGQRVDQLEDKFMAETKSARVEIVEIFQEICHERQAACSKLQEAKLENLHARGQTVCGKLEKILEDRDRRWSKQDELNEKFKSHIYHTKDHGKSWDLQKE